MKQTRKTKSPTSVTFGFVELGEIIGTLAFWQIGAASSERPDATSPSTAMTLSREMSLRTTLADSPCLDCVSSVMRSNFRPSTPPAALSSSMASSVPLCDDWPNVASLPVSEANSPTLMTALAEPFPPSLPLLASSGFLQAVRMEPVETAIAARAWRRVN